MSFLKYIHSSAIPICTALTPMGNEFSTRVWLTSGSISISLRNHQLQTNPQLEVSTDETFLTPRWKEFSLAWSCEGLMVIFSIVTSVYISEILVLNIPHAWVIEHEEIKMVLTWNLHSLLTSFSSAGKCWTWYQRRKLITNLTHLWTLMSYITDQPGKTCPLMQ